MGDSPSKWEIKAISNNGLFPSKNFNDSPVIGIGSINFKKESFTKMLSTALHFPFITLAVPAYALIRTGASRLFALLKAIKYIICRMNITPRIIQPIVVDMINFDFRISQSQNQPMHQNMPFAKRSRQMGLGIRSLFQFKFIPDLPFVFADSFVITIVNQCVHAFGQRYPFHNNLLVENYT